ncbi:urea ABC transporter substrate-binding protein [Halalkalibacterium halodurans]|uniref:urea ABC transporter substrate-binding protein n=1 Tax=Halalkalibacterium halodurans TaxID=86665 RepID=UPI002E228EAB|nr:urea ABC transporter substrate-binding protein [Halalkalibacterium halodurans]MED4082444.1 urea ABC transporter substrate-binding protein [Halalkalibacterium halodurans]MED4084838.1 urea ABC transporter substrate-binding protein [Halalkalibacterium halodurans]MED4103787.1 urea ABC transporter substrate-binding protein [Halalkalibacterium halodurans]MED4108477.1 urea ABC transporter substrate-binding protein [Halalkalibacterium halodurans]MED4150811.1 urea ABC transporter substrate-binding p
MESSLRKTVFMMAFSLLILAACGEQTAQQQEQSAEQTEVEVGSDQIAVGILHSLSGTMAMSETSVRDAELLAIEEINEAGGVLGKELVPIIEDGASEPNIFAERATKLLQQDEVAVIFGGWTSASRKAMLPVVEENNGLLFYPVQYEGMEASPNIFYAGAAPNQQIVPAVEWLLENRGTEFFLLGSDYVFPRLANAIIKAQLESHGATLVDEQYTPLGHTDYNTIISRIRESEPTVIFNTLNGDSNVAFFKQLTDAGITADDVTVMSVSVAEEEIRGIGADVLAGHLASWNYFQTTDTPENDTFVTAYKKSFGDDRVTGDPIEAGYLMVHLWAQAVEAAGTTDIEAVREAASTIEFSAPGGLVKVDGDNQHLYKTVRIGEVQADGQFEEVWNSGEPVKPDPFLEDYEWAEGISSAAAGN